MAIYSEFSHLKMVIFHSYVSLPEGKWCVLESVQNMINMFVKAGSQIQE